MAISTLSIPNQCAWSASPARWLVTTPGGVDSGMFDQFSSTAWEKLDRPCAVGDPPLTALRPSLKTRSTSRSPHGPTALGLGGRCNPGACPTSLLPDCRSPRPTPCAALTPRPEPSSRCCRFVADRNLDLRNRCCQPSLSPQLHCPLRRTRSAHRGRAACSA